jgi:hypothetical protein
VKVSELQKILKKKKKKTLVFEVYVGCSGAGCVCTWDSSILGCVHEIKSLET